MVVQFLSQLLLYSAFGALGGAVVSGLAVLLGEAIKRNNQ